MDLQELYRQVGIISFLKNESSITLPKKSQEDSYVKINSPFREDKNASFSIHTTHGGWTDFGTGETGDFADFVARLKSIEKKEAIKYLKKKIGVESNIVKKPLPKSYIDVHVLNRWIDRLHNHDDEVAARILLYFYTRKQISPDALKKAKVGLTEKNSIIYPYDFHEDGHVLTWKEVRYIVDADYNVKKEFIHNASPTVFPNYIAESKEENIVICAGENDTLALNSLRLSSNFPFSAICFNCGENSFPKNIDHYFLQKNITILYDNDDAGKKGALKLAQHIAPFAKSLFIASWHNNKYVRSLLSQLREHEQKNETEKAEALKKNLKGFDLCDYLYAHDNPKESIFQLYLFLLKADRFHTIETIANPTCHFFTPPEWKEIRKSQDGMEVMKFNNDKVQVVQAKAAQLIVSKCKVAFYKQNAKKSFLKFEDSSKLWNEISDEMVGNAVFHLLGDHYTARYSRDILHAIKEFYSLNNIRFNSYTNLINLHNTTYDLAHFTPVAAMKEHYHNYRNDYEHIPSAKCPAFDDFLRTVSLNDEDWIQTFWEIAGFCLTHGYDYQKMFWFHGQGGRNGKGTVMRIMQKLTGSYLTKPDISPEKLSGNFFLQNLLNKRLATCGDMPTFWMNIDVIKKLTGGDIISGAVKFQNDEIEFINTAKLVFAMNQMPVLSAHESLDPIKKRIIILPFDYAIKDEDHTIERAFMRELPGIFNKAIEGLKRLQYNKSFTPVERSIELLDKWSVNPINQFFDRHIQKSKAENAELEMIDIWQSYVEWMNANFTRSWVNDKHYCQSSIVLANSLKKYFSIPPEHIVKRSKRLMNNTTTSTAVYKGLQFVSTTDPDETLLF